MHPTQAIMHPISCGMHPIMRFYQNGLLLPKVKQPSQQGWLFCFWEVFAGIRTRAVVNGAPGALQSREVACPAGQVKSRHSDHRKRACHLTGSLPINGMQNPRPLGRHPRAVAASAVNEWGHPPHRPCRRLRGMAAGSSPATPTNTKGHPIWGGPLYIIL